ncbi:MAG: cation transporting ATPase C-terminal domain-containing protein [Thermoanaerobaculia bacterium]|nr:cation transporting ATPase C-terminal domain-containing protein [Thermoanaerobaculia bacterium]
MLAAVALAAYVWALRVYGEGAHARTIALLALVAVQLGHTFNCRSRVASVFTGLFDNLHIWAAAATVVALQGFALAFPPMAHLLGLTPIRANDLIVIAICALLPIAIVEMQKVFVRARLDHRGA